MIFKNLLQIKNFDLSCEFTIFILCAEKLEFLKHYFLLLQNKLSFFILKIKYTIFLSNYLLGEL